MDYVICFFLLCFFWDAITDGIEKVVRSFREKNEHVLPPAPPRKTRQISMRVSLSRKKKSKAKPRVRITEATVYNVTHPKTGESVQVFASSEEEARLVASRSLRVEEEDLEAIEVYEKVLRK